MNFDVVGLGLSTVDHLGVVEALPSFDEVAFVSDYDQQGGGPVATALVTLARLGARVALCRPGNTSLRKPQRVDLRNGTAGDGRRI